MALRPDLAIGLPFRVLRALGSTEKTNYIPPIQSIGYKTPCVKSSGRRILLLGEADPYPPSKRMQENDFQIPPKPAPPFLLF